MQCQLAPTDLEKFCRDVCETLEFGDNRQHPIYLSCSGEYQNVEVDRALLNRILTNLISNAIKYSPENSHIYIDLCCDDQNIILKIKDEGIGIPSENQQHLFKTFYRCSNVGQIKGTGLGLAVVKKCVDAHQGQIYFESQEGMGTTVTVQIPLMVSDSNYKLQNIT
jgi:signal transduction histidine kinase